ncbi:glycosyltransferase [Streptacidiphilus cavernicola]|uniref:Glycosyltransferase n=1 Tax=Streptacidiphilus cavernicola TaxID=3342716 RepID=A0ABV6VT38_9ACTN
MTRTYLFQPWSHGVGFGYIGRALTIATELRAAGHRCVFACDAAEGLVARSGFEIATQRGAHSRAVPDMGRRQGSYVSISDLDTAFAIAGYYHRHRVLEDVRSDLETLDEVRPDAVVVDMQPTAAIAARSRGIPLISVGDSDFFRSTDNSWMPWIDGGATVRPYPSCVPAFNAAIEQVGGPTVEHVCDLLRGDLTLVASTPELEAGQEPLPTGDDIRFIGPVFWDPPWTTVADDLRGFGEGRRKVYITLGHGGKSTADQLKPILEACDDPGIAVFLSHGFRGDHAPALPGNVRAGVFTGISAPIGWSDLVVNHGGYSTVLTSLQQGKPQVVIPFMSEQEANGVLFVEGNDAGFVLRRTEPATGNAHYTHRLRYSGLSADGGYDAGEWRLAVEEALGDPRFALGAARAADRMRPWIEGRSFPDLFDRFHGGRLPSAALSTPLEA